MAKREMTDGDRAMQAFLAESEAKSAIELDHYMRNIRLSPTWKMGAQRILDRKRVEESVDRQHEADSLARRNTAASETQAAAAESANRKSTWAICLSVVAVVITALDALANFIKG